MVDTRTDTLFLEIDPVMDNAMSAGDGATLGRLLADDFIYTHSNGNSQNKREFIDAIVARENPPQRPLTEIKSEIHGDIAVTRGNLNVVYNDGRPQLYFRYVRVYRNQDGSWRPISHRTLYASDREQTK
jgi:ketosteroid isomerase-like protein